MVAAGLMVGDAYAAEGVKLELGGRYMATAGVNFDDFDAPGIDSNIRDYVFKQDVEVYFKGSTVLDNGLEVGARIELEGQTSADQIDAVYMYFSGGFGQIRFGDTAEALAQMCYLVPTASALFGADSPFFNFSNAGAIGYGATNGTCYGVDDKSTKVVYFSPNWGGFSFAASFTPDNTEDTRNTSQGIATRFNNNPGQNSENISVAATFSHDFNGVNLVMGGGATWSLDRENNGTVAPITVGGATADERNEYNAYANVSFSGFTIGGAWSLRENISATDSGVDAMVYGIGGTYNWDAWTVGIGWTLGEYDQSGPGAGDDDYNIIAGTASYALGPGIQIDGVIEYDNYNSATPNNSYEGFGFGIGTLINF